MIKKLLINLLTVFVILGIVAFAALKIGGKFLLAKGLEGAIGVPVDVRALDWNLANSEVAVYGVKIQNPKGFNEPVLALLPEIFIRYDVPAFLRNEVHLSEVRIDLHEITVERNKQGWINLTQLPAVREAVGQWGNLVPGALPPEGQGSLESASQNTQNPFAASSSPAEGAANEAGSQNPKSQPGGSAYKIKEVKIDRVEIDFGGARYVDNTKEKPLIKEFEIGVKNFVLENVTDPRQVTQQIVMRVMREFGVKFFLGTQLQQFGIDPTMINEWAEKLKWPFAKPEQTQ